MNWKIFNWKSKKDLAIAAAIAVVSVLYFVKELRDHNDVRNVEHRIQELEHQLKEHAK
jgi:C4-dicarboxylate transporter